MAVWWLSKMITCGTTIISAALFSYIIILHNRMKKEEASKADDNIIFEIKITNTSLPNVHNRKQVLTKNSTSPNNTLLTSKVGQVVSHLSKQTMSNTPIKLSSYSKKLMQLNGEKNGSSINQNGGRSVARDDSSVTIILNNPASICKNEFSSVQDNSNRSLVIHINNLMDSTSNTIELKALNKLVKLSMLDTKTFSASTNYSNNNRSTNLIIIKQKDVTQEIDIIIPALNDRRVAEHKFHANRIMNTRNNQCIKEQEKSDIIITFKASI